MGYGDDIIATGIVKGAFARGKRIALGDGKRIIWGPFSAEIFRGNPNIAPPGQESAADIEWFKFHPGHRVYAKHSANWDRLIWNYDFKVSAGEIYFKNSPKSRGDNLITIEPNVFKGDRSGKEYSVNKQWPVERYQQVADHLLAKGFQVVQPFYRKSVVRLRNVQIVQTPTFTDVLALLKVARLHVGPEGGLQQGAAAVGIRAVILFGGFSPPQIMGHDTHINLVGDPTPCGNIRIACVHCSEAMKRISVDEVIGKIEKIIC